MNVARKKITRRIKRRAVVFSRRVGLKAVMSADAAIRRVKGEGRPKGRKGVIRILLLFILSGFIAYSAAERGVIEKVKARVFPPDPMPLKRVIQAQSPEAAAQKTAEAPATGGHAMPWDRFFSRGRSIDYSKMKAQALVCRERMYGLSRDGVVLPFGDASDANLPLITGTGEEPLSVGDTLRAGLPALDLARAAMKISPELLERISEIALLPGGSLQVRFMDTRLTAVLRGGNPGPQLANLRLFLRHPPLPQSGTLDMRYGNVAYLKEEE